MGIIRFSVGDILLMKKKHPCSSDRFAVLRVGSDVRIKCCVCERNLTLPRESLERSIKKIITAEDAENKDGI